MNNNERTIGELSPEALDVIAEALPEPRLTMNDYAKATEALYQCAIGNTGSSRAAAQLLLSAYSGYNWQLDVTDLCLLHGNLKQQALIFIECRLTLRKEPNRVLGSGEPLFCNCGELEPHRVMDSGYKKFSALANQWRRYHIRNRWKQECYECYGKGKVYLNRDDDNGHRTKPCPDCDGKEACWQKWRSSEPTGPALSDSGSAMSAHSGHGL